KLQLVDALLQRNGQKIRMISHTFRYPGTSKLDRIEERYKSSSRVDHGLVCPHESILSALEQEYERLNGRLLRGTHIKCLENRGDSYAISLSSGEELQTPIFVAVDGTFSPTRRMAGLQRIEFTSSRVMSGALVANLEIPPGEFYTEDLSTDGVLYGFTF